MLSQVNSLDSIWTPTTVTDRSQQHVEDAAQVALWTVFDNNGTNSFEIVFDTDDFGDTFDVFLNIEDEQNVVSNDPELELPSWNRSV